MGRGTDTKEQKIEKIKKYLETRQDIVGFDEKSFIGMTQKISFIDKDYGSFLIKPSTLMQRNTSHRQRTKEKIKETSLKKYGVEHPRKAESVKLKQKQTNLQKYGVENYTQSKICQDKTKQTNIRKYGVENPFQSTEIKNKIKNTNLKRYGVENPNHNREIRNKIDQTNLKKYGVKNPFQNEDIKTKIKQINLQKYGVTNPNKNIQIQSKIKKTNMKKYGTYNPSKSKIIKEKIKQINLEKYGVEWTSLHKETREKQKQTNLKKYGSEFPLNNKEVQNKIKQNHLDKYGVENPFQRKDVLDKAKKTTIEKYGTDCIFKNKNIQEKIKKTNLKKYGFEYPQQNKEMKNKAMQTLHKNIVNNKGSSKGEIELKTWLISLKLEPKKHSSGAKEIDLYIENIKTGIEYNGLYWHSLKRKEKNYHVDKMIYYKNQGIKIINIWEHWWINKKKQTKNIIKQLLKIDLIHVNYENIKIKKIDYNLTIDFINKNHIENYCSFFSSIGLYYNKLLLSVCALSLKEKRIFIRIYKLNNYLIKNDIRIISDYVSNFFKKDIYTILNKSISNEIDYLNNKWIFENEIAPSIQKIRKNNNENHEICDCGEILLKFPFKENL